MNALDVIQLPISRADVCKLLSSSFVLTPRQVSKIRASIRYGKYHAMLEELRGFQWKGEQFTLNRMMDERDTYLQENLLRQIVGRAYYEWRGLVDLERSTSFVLEGEVTEEILSVWDVAKRMDWLKMFALEKAVAEKATDLRIAILNYQSYTGKTYWLPDEWKHYNSIVGKSTGGTAKKSKHKKGSDDLVGHHKPSKQQLLEAASK